MTKRIVAAALIQPSSVPVHVHSQPDNHSCMQEVAEEDNAMQSSSQSETAADSRDDEDYVPEPLPKPKSWSCGANEDGEGQQSSAHPKGRQCEQRMVRLLSQPYTLLAVMHCLLKYTLWRWSNG